MRPLFLFIIAALICTGATAQKRSVYKGLKTKKYYAVNSNFAVNGSETVYKLNGKVIDKKAYDKYQSTRKNYDNCCPCMLESYDANEVLLERAVKCGECGVGSFTRYYANGLPRMKGQYKENPSGNWTGLSERGYCGVREGKWIYFGEQGDTLYVEYWNNGEFVKQLPEKIDSNALWKAEAIRSPSATPYEKTFDLESVDSIEMQTYFREMMLRDEEATMRLEISSPGKDPYYKDIRLEELTPQSLNTIISSNNFDHGENTFVLVRYMNKGVQVGNYRIGKDGGKSKTYPVKPGLPALPPAEEQR